MKLSLHTIQGDRYDVDYDEIKQVHDTPYKGTVVVLKNGVIIPWVKGMAHEIRQEIMQHASNKR